MADLTMEQARRYFDYRDGLLIWKARPRSEFQTDGAFVGWNRKFPGRVAGSADSRGYCSVRITVDGK